jgi:hypothetical protein
MVLFTFGWSPFDNAINYNERGHYRVKHLLLIVAFVMVLSCIIFMGFGVFHIGQTIGDVAAPVAQRSGIAGLQSKGLCEDK